MAKVSIIIKSLNSPQTNHSDSANQNFKYPTLKAMIKLYKSYMYAILQPSQLHECYIATIPATWMLYCNHHSILAIKQKTSSLVFTLSTSGADGIIKDIRI